MRLGLRQLSAAAVLVGTLMVLLAGCASSNSNRRVHQIFHMAWLGSQGQDITPPDPGTCNDTTCIPVVNLLFDGLVTLDANLNVEKWGADDITISPDGLTYTFHLRGGQEFSDGMPVTASDYAYAMNRSLDPCLNSAVSYYLWAIKDAQDFSAEGCSGGQENGRKTLIGDSIVPDDGASRLIVTLTKPAGYFLAALSYSTAFALEPKVVAGASLGADEKWLDTLKRGASGQGGSGMFYVSAYDHAGNLVLKANPHWWGRNAGKKLALTEVDFKIFADADSMYDAYNTGTLYDYLNRVPSSRLAEARAQSDEHDAPILAVQTVALNWDIPPFDNRDARQSFCLALNRDDLVRRVLNGSQLPSYHLVPKGMPGYNSALAGPGGLSDTAGDLGKARSHWNAYKATLGGRPIPPIQFTYDVSDNGSQTGKSYAEALQTQWDAAFPDAKVTLNPVSMPVRIQLERQKKLQAYRFAWPADYPDPQNFLSQLYATTAGYNYSNASVPDVDALLARADQASPVAAGRLALYMQAEQKLVDAVAVCGVYQYANHYRLRATVRNYAENGLFFTPADSWVAMYLTNS